jgi:poly(3-hydroxybutyrate) depolymerase
LVFLHGAGQSADEMFGCLGTAPEEAGVAVLAPNSRDPEAVATGCTGAWRLMFEP